MSLTQAHAHNLFYKHVHVERQSSFAWNGAKREHLTGSAAHVAVSLVDLKIDISFSLFPFLWMSLSFSIDFQLCQWHLYSSIILLNNKKTTIKKAISLNARVSSKTAKKVATWNRSGVITDIRRFPFLTKKLNRWLDKWALQRWNMTAAFFSWTYACKLVLHVQDFSEKGCPDLQM